jgi:hypothetical protein
MTDPVCRGHRGLSDERGIAHCLYELMFDGLERVQLVASGATEFLRNDQCWDANAH